MGEVIEYPLDMDKLDRLAKVAAERFLLLIDLIQMKPVLQRGGGFQEIDGYFFPLNSFKTTKLSDLWLLRSWEEHFRRFGIRTQRSFWGGDIWVHPRHEVGYLGNVHYVDLAVCREDQAQIPEGL